MKPVHPPFSPRTSAMNDGVKRAVPLLLCLPLLLFSPLEGRAQDAVEGAWSGEEYILAEGAVHPIAGQIFFTDGQWQVLFFVLEDGVPKRGSAEGGTY